MKLPFDWSRGGERKKLGNECRGRPTVKSLSQRVQSRGNEVDCTSKSRGKRTRGLSNLSLRELKSNCGNRETRGALKDEHVARVNVTAVDKWTELLRCEHRKCLIAS